jgi:hypothetical protein
MTSEELSAILDALARVRPVCKGDLHELGLKQMQNPRYSKQLQGLGASVSSFRLVGFEGVKRGRANRCQYTPEFAAYDARGALLFYFINVAWQSGGNGPELTR